MNREPGQTTTKVVKILKVKSGVPTKILFEGNEYTLLHQYSQKDNKHERTR